MSTQEPDARDRELAELRVEVERLRKIVRDIGTTALRSDVKALGFVQWVKAREPWIAQIMIAYEEGGDLFKAVDEFITFSLQNPPPGAKL